MTNTVPTLIHEWESLVTRADLIYLGVLATVFLLTIIAFAVMSRNKPPPPKA